MDIKDSEELLVRSFDAKLSDAERLALTAALEQDSRLKQYSRQFSELRERLWRPHPDSFGPFFAERIVNAIRNLKTSIDYQVFFFFRKYQLAAVGIVIALIVMNILSSDQLTLKSVLGMEEQNVELVQDIDFFGDLSN